MVSRVLCSECGSNLFVQEHHVSHDPEVTQNLCVLCHAKKHPDKYNLILSTARCTKNKSRWNIPLHALAQRAGVTPAAVVLRAQRQGVLSGILSPEQEALLSAPSVFALGKVAGKQRDYHISLDEELNQRFLKYLTSEFREGSHVASAVIRKALEEFLRKKGF